MIDPKKIVILIPTYKRWYRSIFTRCLEALAQGEPVLSRQSKIIIQDDGSEKGLGKAGIETGILKTCYYYGLRGNVSVKAYPNQGIGARRFSLAESGFAVCGPKGFLYYLDDDVKIKKGCITEAIKCLMSDKTYGIVSAYGSYKRFNPNATAPFEVPSTGTAFAVRASLMQSCNFDRRMRIREDTDFCIQVKLQGYKVVVCPKSDIIHVRAQANTTGKGHGVGGMAEANNVSYSHWNRFLAKKWKGIVQLDVAGRVRFSQNIKKILEARRKRG